MEKKLQPKSNILLNGSSNKKQNQFANINSPDCSIEHQQMSHSEKLTLSALLHQHEPVCSIVIGKDKGNILPLIAHYSKVAFSLCRDSLIEEKFNHLKNTRFLNGPITLVLPALLQELTANNIPVDLILINDNYSAEEMKNNLNIILSYQPMKQLFILIHNSFNPDCRKGIQETDWKQSPFLDFVDLDFIPGRMIADESPPRKQLFGGLCLACLHHSPHKNEVKIQTPAA